MYKFLFVMLASLCLLRCNSQKELSLMDQLAIQVIDTTRAFSYSNKKYGQYYGETNSYFKNGWQGWTLKEQRIFNDYKIVIDGKPLERNTSAAMVYPHILKRIYENGITEKFFFADSLDLIVIELDNLNTDSVILNFEGTAGEKDIILTTNIAEIDISNIIPGNKLFITSNKKISSSSQKDISIITEGNDLKIILTISHSSEHLKYLLDNTENLISTKQNRIEKLLSESYVKSNNDEFDKALMWTKISLDALITEQDSKGIFAGLPWFNNYWGRDTFISLPGATFVQGNYQDAKEILLAFSKFQDTNPNSKYYGRIPNRITLNEKIYNTADGTPWFVIQSYNYFNYSNDTTFLNKIYPSVKLAYEAAVRQHTDENGFLTHADAETWMDAVGPNGPWSPRENRANDIQALWYRQLLFSADIAKSVGDTVTGNKILNSAFLLSSNFEKSFVDTSNLVIYDHLKKDGTADASFRPNAFFVLNEPGLFSSSLTRLKLLGNYMKEIVLPYGVLSLSQNDDNFHPFHEYPPYYVKDAAYHNGIIWQWNSGPVIQTLCSFGKQDTAWNLTKELTNQILKKGAVGNLAELMDAFPVEGKSEPGLSGTFSQAWSLAEYIRNFYQDYLGVRPDAPHKALYLLPTIPSELTNIEFLQKIGNDHLRIKYLFTDDIYRISIDASQIKDSLDIGAAIFNKADANFQLKTVINKSDKLIIEVPAYSNSKQDLHVYRNNIEIAVVSQIYNEPIENLELFEKITFAKPVLRTKLASLKNPGYILLTNSETKIVNDNADLLFDKSSPVNDEKYDYPTNQNFVKGILDLKRFELEKDKNRYYFTLTYNKLHNPGWHYEYGYQLTFTSICIQNNSEGKRNRHVGVNSNFILPESRDFNKIINIGGGFEIKDYDGKIIAAYIPKQDDTKNPLGNTKTNTISFSIPVELIGELTEKSIITVLVGAQDDHGGAGIGEFRTVDENATEWTGGGKKDKTNDNVYDVLFVN